MEHRFEKYCKNYTNIENYDKALADNFKGWCCHHRKGVDITREELISLGMYYDRPASELIFLTRSEHKSLHKPSDDTKNKMSEASKGKYAGEKNPMYGKHPAEETRKKIAEAARINSIGRHWYNNGKENRFCFECPPGFVTGMLKRK